MRRLCAASIAAIVALAGLGGMAGPGVSASSDVTPSSSLDWAQVGADIEGEAYEDQSGFSVATSSDGSRVVIGTHLSDGNGTDSGHVRIFDFDGSD